tara:strand:- start:126 stop:341 length:216 start_codon:yes stop_codon:yes gene_type:complete
MKLDYDKETDSLYIHLSESSAVDSEEVRVGVVLDYSEDGTLVGIDIQHASQTTDIGQLVVNHLPVTHFNAA